MFIFIVAGPSKTPPSKAAEGSNQVMMSTGSSSDQYQTVTIVPSDGDTGEVGIWHILICLLRFYILLYELGQF